MENQTIYPEHSIFSF